MYPGPPGRAAMPTSPGVPSAHSWMAPVPGQTDTPQGAAAAPSSCFSVTALHPPSSPACTHFAFPEPVVFVLKSRAVSARPLQDHPSKTFLLPRAAPRAQLCGTFRNPSQSGNSWRSFLTLAEVSGPKVFLALDRQSTQGGPHSWKRGLAFFAGTGPVIISPPLWAVLTALGVKPFLAPSD